MLDKIYLVRETSNNSHDDRAIRELGEKLDKRIDQILETKDRVDISLKEYERLRESVKKYERQLRDMGNLFAQMGIPVEVVESIDSDSVVVNYVDNAMTFKRQYNIRFEVFDDPINRKWRHEY